MSTSDLDRLGWPALRMMVRQFTLVGSFTQKVHAMISAGGFVSFTPTFTLGIIEPNRNSFRVMSSRRPFYPG